MRIHEMTISIVADNGWMDARENVINDLQDAVNDDWMWQHADYYALTMERAIALLKEQEPVKPNLDVDEWMCGNCGHKLEHQELLGYKMLFYEQYNYCPNCGRKVKWE